MHVVAELAHVWNAQHRRATVVRVIDSAGLGPRHDHDMLFVAVDGTTAGSLLGGAATGHIVDRSWALLETPATSVVETVEIATHDAVAAGLTCGGSVNVLIQRLDSVPDALWTTLADRRPAALATVAGATTGAIVILPDRRVVGSLDSAELDTTAATAAEVLLSHPGSRHERLAVGAIEVIVESWNPAPRLLILGVNDLAEAISRQAELLGWHPTVVADRDRALEHLFEFSSGDVVIALEHDPEIAIPVLAAALREQLGYVGALGSRRTQELRREALVGAGVRDTELDRYHGPVGLDLGGRTPAETAVSIVAEIIAERSGRNGQPLGGS